MCELNVEVIHQWYKIDATKRVVHDNDELEKKKRARNIFDQEEMEEIGMIEEKRKKVL